MSWRSVRFHRVSQRVRVLRWGRVSQWVLGLLLCWGLLSAASQPIRAQSAQASPGGGERKVIAVLTDWTGNFIGGSGQTERVREETRDRVSELLFPSSGEPSPFGFDAERDRLFIARFGLVTERPGIRPLRDFLQIQLDIDVDLGRLGDSGQKRRLARAFERDSRRLKTSRGSSGAQWGFPTVVWTIAVDRINQRAEELGLSFESIVLVLVSDDVQNLGKGLASEATACARVLRRYSRPDSQRFESFYDLYTKHLTTERVSGISIDPIQGVGQDGEGLVRAFRIAPGVVGVDLNRVFNVESQGFSIRADGTYRGDLRVDLDPSPLYPATMVELGAELRDAAGGPVFDLGSVAGSAGDGWDTLPGALGSGDRDSRTYHLRLQGELVYPEIAELSRFRTPLTYQSPVKIELEGLLKLADGGLLTSELMEGEETPEAARRRIDGFKDIVSNFKWAIVALIAFVIALAVFYRVALYRPPLLQVAAAASKAAPVVDWRGGDKVLPAVPVGAIDLTNQRSRGGVHKEWTARLEVVSVECDRDLVLADTALVDGKALSELFSFAGDGTSQVVSDELAGKKGESVPFHLRTDRIADLEAPGLPDDQGNFRAEFTATVAIRAEHEMAVETCTFTVPVIFAAPRPRWSVEWLDVEALDVESPDEKTFLYNELLERPAEVRRWRIFHSAERQALWPCEVRLAVLGPEGQAVEGLRLVVPDGGLENEDIEIEDGARICVGRFGLRPSVPVAVEYSARALPAPKQIDTEISLRIFDLTGDEAKMRGGPAAFKVGLDTREPHPIFRLEAVRQSQRVSIVDTSLKRPDGGLIKLDPIHPLLSGEKLEDAWTFVAKLDLGNAAEKAHPNPVGVDGQGADGQMDPGTVSFQFGHLEVEADFDSLGMTREELVKCFRMVKKSARERNSAKAVDVLTTQSPFGFLAPGPHAWETYQLELNQLGFEGLAVDTGEVQLTLHFEGFVRDVRVERFSQSLHLPLIADYGERWFLMDIGTSAIVAMSMNGSSMNGSQDSPGFLELARGQDGTVTGGGQDPRLLPSTLFIEKDTSDPDGYRLVFRDSPEDVEVSSAYRLLPAFKLLVGSQHLPLTRRELQDLGLEEAPSVDDILRKALGTLLKDYVKPALERQSEDGEEELPRQVLLTIPNTFTPAHVAVIRDLFRQEFDARRVVFLSESDAICWRYLTLVQDGHESLPKRFHDQTEYALIVDVGAGTTDLTYVALKRRGWRDLEHATILHRDGFRVAGNNVDTCLGRIVHHKLSSLKTIGDSPYLYDAQHQIFPSGTGEERLEERFLYPIVLGLRDLKADLAKNQHETLRLRISNDIPLFTEQRSADQQGEVFEWVRNWLRIGVGEGQRSTDIRLEPDEILHAPAYSSLIHRQMSTDILGHFFAGCPLQWEGAPGDWCRDGRFPVDTMVITGRGGLTPGLRAVLESALDEFRLHTAEPVRQPDFSRHGKPEDLKLAVVEGVRDYIERFGAQSGLSNRELVRDRGLYEDYYLYTGPGRSYAKCWKLLDRDDHIAKPVGPGGEGGGPTLLRFESPERSMVPFTDANGGVMVVATSSRTPPKNPESPDTFIRPFCQFSQKNVNRPVEIYFHVDSNRDFELRVDGQNIKGRENRIKSEFFEGLPGVLENMWPGRPCEPGDAANFFSPLLPVAGLPEERPPEPMPEEEPAEEIEALAEALTDSSLEESSLEDSPEVFEEIPPVPDPPVPAKPTGPRIAFADFDD